MRSLLSYVPLFYPIDRRIITRSTITLDSRPIQTHQFSATKWATWSPLRNPAMIWSRTHQFSPKKMPLRSLGRAAELRLCRPSTRDHQLPRTGNDVIKTARGQRGRTLWPADGQRWGQLGGECRIHDQAWDKGEDFILNSSLWGLRFMSPRIRQVKRNILNESLCSCRSSLLSRSQLLPETLGTVDNNIC